MYPDREKTIRLLLNAAGRAAANTDATHPEDIAYAMINALETAPEVILECHKVFSRAR